MFIADDCYFTSDLHFNHKNIIQYCNRPYNSVEEMNLDIIETWNKTIPQDATVFILGDVFFCGTQKAIQLFSQLNGKELHLIRGNHDKGMKDSVRNLFTSIRDMREIRIMDDEGMQWITLNHFAMSVWNNSHRGTWQLFGHSHGSYEGVGKQMDVGWDVWGRPLSYYEIKEKMMNKEIYFPDHHNEETL